PSGKQLASLCGTYMAEPFDLSCEQAHSKAAWYFLCQADSKEFFQKKALQYWKPDGTEVKIDVSKGRLDAVMKEHRDFWTKCVQKVQQLGMNLRGKEILKLMGSSLGSGPDEPSDLASNLDALCQMLACFYSQALVHNAPYDPTTENRRGDVFDL